MSFVQPVAIDRSLPIPGGGGPEHLGFGGDVTLQVQTKTLRGRRAECDYPIGIQEGHDAIDTGVGQAAKRGHRPGAFRLGHASARADGIMSDAANGILTYSTSGFVDGTTGVTGTNAITYSAVNNASVDTVSNLPLGEFQVAALGASQTTTYNNTPFSFTLIPVGV